jgi:hypothetical protein
MLKWLLIFLATPALAQQTSTNNKFLSLASVAACCTRSQQQCTALHCDGITTKYWWSCQVAPDNTAAVTTVPGDPNFDATTSNQVSGGVVGLSTSEQSSQQTETQMGVKLPWQMTKAAFQARFTTAELQAFQQSGIAAVKQCWTNTQAATNINVRATTTIDCAATHLVAAGILTADRAQQVLAEISVALSCQ